jgi:hypothetical protein
LIEAERAAETKRTGLDAVDNKRLYHKRLYHGAS